MNDDDDDDDDDTTHDTKLHRPPLTQLLPTHAVMQPNCPITHCQAGLPQSAAAGPADHDGLGRGRRGKRQARLDDLLAIEQLSIIDLLVLQAGSLGPLVVEVLLALRSEDPLLGELMPDLGLVVSKVEGDICKVVFGVSDIRLDTFLKNPGNEVIILSTVTLDGASELMTKSRPSCGVSLAVSARLIGLYATLEIVSHVIP